MPFEIDVVYVVSGLAVGLLVGLTGVGGGSLMTPLLTVLFGVPATTAVGTDLAFAAITKGAGTLVHRLRNTVNWKIVGLACLGSVPASVVTIGILHGLDIQNAGKGSPIDQFIRWSIAFCVMLTVIALIFKTKVVTWLQNHPKAQLQDKTRSVATVVAFAVIGMLVTVSSIGAGAVGVMALFMLYPHLKASEIAGTDIAYAVPLTTVAAFGHFSLGTVDFGLLGALLIGSIPGITVGSYLSRAVPERFLRGVLATTLTAVAAKLVM
ncbi:sulfite exporter TauE/SafE family protein [Limnobacter sp.]|uniref:sulfite exporter TauE/SafE family protein n=1 Tax=Limnobacter sp. TaxID=2003368 RepID=UPI0035130BFE